jgi:crotonobetainyl-CoA:carnitine CoA-transferase CaiB-like acyl-CoA transferase
VFKAADGEFMLATATDAQFVRLCRALRLDALTQDERFRTVSARLAARADLDALLSERFVQDTVEVWLDRLQAAGISAGRVNDLRQSLESELTVERHLLMEPDESVWPAGMPLLRLPVDAEGTGARRPPPKLGEHSVEVLSAVGYDTEAIARLTSLTTSRR